MSSLNVCLPTRARGRGDLEPFLGMAGNAALQRALCAAIVAIAAAPRGSKASIWGEGGLPYPVNNHVFPERSVKLPILDFEVTIPYHTH